MKRIINRLFLLPLIASAVSGCSDKPLTFEHEEPQFDLNSNAILLEVLLPTSSTDEDSYYIVGEFNGGQAAIGDPMWQLQKASTGIQKWGVYLNPSSFVGGKTLADGFTFHSVTQGEERSLKNEKVTHTLNVGIGSRTNVWVEQWETYFGERARQYARVYLFNQIAWEELALYWYGGGSAGSGGWPGRRPSGTETINGIRFSYWNMDEADNGRTINIIPNNNDNGEQIEDDPTKNWFVDGDYYLALTKNGSVVMDPDNLVEPYDGFTVFVDDQTGWDNLAMFGWMNYAPVDADYPGWKVDGTTTVNGVEYKYFKVPDSMNDKVFNIVFNNSQPVNSSNKKEVNGPQNYTHNADIYLQLTEDGYKTVIFNPESRKIFLNDTTGWDEITLHYWGGGSAGTTWPGIDPSGTESVGGTSYTVFTLPEELDGKTINWILNNKGAGEQYDCPSITLDRDFYFNATATGATEVTP